VSITTLGKLLRYLIVVGFVAFYQGM